jgi:hypothetical protein
MKDGEFGGGSAGPAQQQRGHEQSYLRENLFHGILFVDDEPPILANLILTLAFLRQSF